MEMNKLTMERVADKVLKALENEDIKNKEAAEILGVNMSYFSHLTKATNHHLVSKKAWQIMHDWSVLAVPLRGYKITTPDVKPEVSDSDKMFKERNAAFAKEQTAAALRESYEQLQADDPEPESKTVTVTCSPSDVDQRSGVLASLVIFENGSFTLTYKPTPEK